MPKELHTPPQFPDINPIEHLWNELGRKIRKHTLKNKEQLRNTLEME